MDGLQIQDVFDPYYAGRKPFLPKTLRPRAAKRRKNVGETKPRERKDDPTRKRGSP